MEFDAEQLAGALDVIGFLARSPGRVRVLETLAEGPRDRAALQEATGVPRTTVGRIVTNLHDRRLITQRGHECRITPLGELLTAEFASLLRTAVTVEDLRPVLPWLPVEEFDFSLARFADAEITLAKPHDSIAPVRRGMETFASADRLRLLMPGYIPDGLKVVWEATVHGNQTFEAIVTAAVVESIVADPETARMLEELVISDRGTLYRYDGTISYILEIADDTVVFGLSDEDGAPRALIETDDEAIYSWAESTIETYRDAAESLDPDLLRE